MTEERPSSIILERAESRALRKVCEAGVRPCDFFCRPEDRREKDERETDEREKDESTRRSRRGLLRWNGPNGSEEERKKTGGEPSERDSERRSGRSGAKGGAT